MYITYIYIYTGIPESLGLKGVSSQELYLGLELSRYVPRIYQLNGPIVIPSIVPVSVKTRKDSA